MAVSTKSLAQHISKQITDRFEINLRIGFTKDITVEFTRTELRTFTGTDRIKDVSIIQMLKELNAEGYVVRGESGGENFRVTFQVEEYLTKAYTLQELVDGNDYLEDILTPVSATNHV